MASQAPVQMPSRPPNLVIQKPFLPIVLLGVHLMIILMVLLVFVWADNEDTDAKYLGGLNMGDKLFNWHPVFMTWGFSCLVEGAVAYRAMRFYPHRRKRTVHGLWHALGAVLLSLGLAVVFKYKHKHDLASLYSTHSWLGIFTVTLVFAQFVLGVGVYALPRVPLLTKQYMYPLHAAMGLASTVSAAAAVLSGIDHENTLLGCAYSVRNKDLDPAAHYADIPAGCRHSNGIAVLVMVCLVLVVYALTNLKSASSAQVSYAGSKPRGPGAPFPFHPGMMAADQQPDRVYYGTPVTSSSAAGRTAAPVGHRGVGLLHSREHREDSVSSLILGSGFEEPTARLGDDDDEGAGDDDMSTLDPETSRLLS